MLPVTVACSCPRVTATSAACGGGAHLQLVVLGAQAVGLLLGGLGGGAGVDGLLVGLVQGLVDALQPPGQAVGLVLRPLALGLLRKRSTFGLDAADDRQAGAVLAWHQDSYRFELTCPLTAVLVALLSKTRRPWGDNSMHGVRSIQR